MSRIPGPPVNTCPLKPTAWVEGNGMLGAKRLMWKRPTGWVVAVGFNYSIDGQTIAGFSTLARDLGCWHLAAHVAAVSRWLGPVGRFGTDSYRPPGWSTPSLPVRHECWGGAS